MHRLTWLRVLKLGPHRKALATVAVLVLMVVVPSALSYRASLSSGDTTRAMHHTENVLVTANAAMADLDRMQASYYEFLLTAQDDFLTRYARGRSLYVGEVDTLERLAAEDADQLARWRKVALRAERWQESIAEPGIALRRRGPAGSAADEAVRSWIAVGAGADQIDAIRATFADATAAEQTQSGALRNQANATNAALQNLRVLGTPLVAMLFLLILRLFRAHGARAAAESEQDRTARLQTVTAALSAARTPAEVAIVAVGYCVRAAYAATGSVVCQVNECLQVVHATGDSPEPLAGFQPFPLDARLPLAEAVRTGRAIWLAGTTELGTMDPSFSTPHAPEIRACAAIPLLAGNGTVLGALGLSFGVTQAFEPVERDQLQALADQCARALERAHLYQSERTAHAQAEAAVRVRDEFLAVASHELRSPVTVIKLGVQLLEHSAAQADLVHQEWLHKSVHQLRSGAERLVQLTEDLLDVTRLQTGRLPIRPAQMDLGDLIRRLAATYRLRLTRAQHLVLVCEAIDGMCLLTADLLRVEQVLTNLFENAIKYSPHGGTMRVGIEFQLGGWLVVVQDEGLGFPAGAEESIFEPFGRASNALASQIAGMGLGLYISRQIVAGHGGRLWAESTGEGRGSQFKLWLPLVADSPASEHVLSAVG